jgi:hypothetical protein
MRACSLGIGPVLVALHGLEMKLHPKRSFWALMKL